LLIKESSSNLSLLMEGRKNHPGISSCGSRISRNLSLLLTEECSTCRWRNLLIKESLHNTHSSTFVFFLGFFIFWATFLSLKIFIKIFIKKYINFCINFFIIFLHWHKRISLETIKRLLIIGAKVFDQF
jgi:hypothetical protein